MTQCHPNGEPHLSILRLLNKVVCSNQTVCLGDDVHLLRLTVISCRKKEDRKTTELLKDAFHLDSLQREDFAIDCFKREATTSEIGLGCVLPPQSERSDRSICSSCMSSAISTRFGISSKDSAIISSLKTEPTTKTGTIVARHGSIVARNSQPTKAHPIALGLKESTVSSSGNLLLTLWSPIGSQVVATNLFSSIFRSAPHSARQFYNQIMTDLMDPETVNSKSFMAKQMLHEMSPLLPSKYEEIDCSFPFDIKSSIEQDTGDFSVKVETNRLIEHQVALRKEYWPRRWEIILCSTSL